MIRVAASEVVASCIARMTPVVDVVSWVGTVRPVRCRLAQNLTPQLCDVRHVRRMLAMLRKCGLSQCSAGPELHRHSHPVGQPGEEVLKPVGLAVLDPDAEQQGAQLQPVYQPPARRLGLPAACPASDGFDARHTTGA